MDDTRVSGGTEAGAHDEAATRVASSHGPASVLPSDTSSEGEKQESEAADQDGERGADQDPDAAPAAAADVQVDIEALTAKAGKADEYLELAQRTKADFENFRKRAARDAALAQDRGVAKLAKELLPAVDNLDRALEVAQHDGDSTQILNCTIADNSGYGQADQNVSSCVSHGRLEEQPTRFTDQCSNSSPFCAIR